VLRDRAPVYRLQTSTVLQRPLAEVWSFFARPRNLAAMTPGDQRFAFVGEVPETMRPGDTIDVNVGLGPVRMPWRTRIETIEPPRRFTDAQITGPFGVWFHEHEFVGDGDRTTVIDRVWYAPPFGPLGRLVHWLGLARRLRALFAHRERAAVLRFGAPHDTAP